MASYRVTWVIDVEADSPLEAAIEAEACQRDQAAYEYSGGVFQVVPVINDEADATKEVTIDLEEHYLNNLEEENQ